MAMYPPVGSYRMNPVTREHEVFTGGAGWMPVSGIGQGPLPTGSPNSITSFDPTTVYKDIYTTDHTTTIAPPGNNKFRVITKAGTVVADLETGELTVPIGVSRQQMLREFWLAFQEHFKGGNAAKYEQEIKKLENEIFGYKMEQSKKEKELKKRIQDRLVDKINNTYGNQKFIMMKPDDLIKFLEIPDER